MEKREIEQALRNYPWMVREIARLRGMLSGAGDRITQQYGLESVMPKARGGTSDPVHMEVARRERLWKRVERLERKVQYIQQRIDKIDNEREQTVLHCMLDGMSMVAIGRHMGLSRKTIYSIKESIITQITHFTHNTHDMTKEKACV